MLVLDKKGRSLFTKSMPKKKVAGEALEEIAEQTSSEKEASDAVTASICFHCKKPVTEYKCAKGDRNQYKFCSIECFNQDKTG